MFKRTKLSTAALVALGGVMLALPAAAQQVAERVEITGSRFKTTETEGAAPVISLGAEAIKIEAVRSAEQLLNNLPQVMPDYGAQVSNGATGTATVNLRNLGADRTLVLVNGKRVPYGSPRLAAADLNQIPVPLIKRVDVLTGGASAVYGADAVGGVINFVMNDRFEGLQLELNHQFYNHQQGNPKDVNTALNARNFAIPGDKDADGDVTDFSMTLGGNFAGGKGNAAVYFGYKKEKALLQSERDFSSCSFGTNGDVFTCGGSSTGFPGRFITDNGNFTVADANGGTRTWTNARDAYNFGPLNYFQRPSDRYSVAAFTRYDISDKARAYLEATFHDDHTVAQIAPSGLFGFDASGANAVRYENPLLSDAWRAALGLTAPGQTADALIFRRNVEGGGRQDDIRHTSFRIVTGVKGDIGPISYDVFAQTGKVIYQNTYKNDFSIARSARALDIVTDPATGQAVCRSVLDGSDPNCVPYNIWKLGGVTPEALAYLQTPGFQKGFTSQSIIGGNVQVDLGQYGLKLPTASDGLGLLVGFERRSEKLDLSTDTAFTTGDLAGQGGPTFSVGGQYSVKDVFAELKIPLMSKKPFVELLNLSASYRYSDYSTGNKSDTYGVGVEYAPVKAFKLRGSVQRAVRAPNVIDLFTPSGLGLFNIPNGDPCGPSRRNTVEECARTGLPASLYGSELLDNPAGQYNNVTGGNTALKPETSDSMTFGLVFSPTRDLDVTLDYYDIKVKGGIGTVPEATTLTNCLETGDASLCSLIQRDSRGTLWATPQGFISAQNANLSTERTSGFDIGANYRAKLGAMGLMDVSFIGTLLQKYETEAFAGDGVYDCAGYFGDVCGRVTTGVLPKWRHKLRATWSTPWKVDLTATWRHISSVKHETASSAKQLTGEIDPVMAKFPSFNYLDISAKYDITKNLAVRLAINNLLDKDPPLAVTGAPYGNGNTYPVMYDALGRRISLNLTATF